MQRYHVPRWRKSVKDPLGAKARRWSLGFMDLFHQAFRGALVWVSSKQAHDCFDWMPFFRHRHCSKRDGEMLVVLEFTKFIEMDNLNVERFAEAVTQFISQLLSDVFRYLHARVRHDTSSQLLNKPSENDR